MPAKVEITPALPSLSPVGSKPVIARFDGGRLSSDGGLLVGHLPRNVPFLGTSLMTA
jgi:hypothetical protein